MAKRNKDILSMQNFVSVRGMLKLSITKVWDKMQYSYMSLL